MISKKLAIAAAVALMAGLSFGPASAQNNQPPAPTMASPSSGGDQSATPAAGDQTAAPAADQAATPAPAAAAPATPPPAAGTPVAAGANPYGLGDLWAKGDFVSKGLLIILAIMSVGTWYIFFVKWFEQSRILGQANQVEKKFWSSNNLNEGIDKLAKNSVFRTVAESGVRAASGQGAGGLINLNDWIAMSLNRQLEEINAKLQGGISFLASVGSVAPFVGLLGTVWGIYHALIAIGLAGQASIDKVAGPVGEALIMTAIGLGVAIPGVLLYNYLVRRNKVINEKLRSFASDLQAYLVTKGK
ncbi:MAG: MotA/TolQ/ExbB proton channel family protein [Proteobacteria bacterium]|jgi:biopolymer transport protein ExbB|nr:MotA/TolQ/ExbB proton channel family protein [Pseudomonadota bacterium]